MRFNAALEAIDFRFKGILAGRYLPDEALFKLTAGVVDSQRPNWTIFPARQWYWMARPTRLRILEELTEGGVLKALAGSQTGRRPSSGIFSGHWSCESLRRNREKPRKNEERGRTGPRKEADRFAHGPDTQDVLQEGFIVMKSVFLR